MSAAKPKQKLKGAAMKKKKVKCPKCGTEINPGKLLAGMTKLTKEQRKQRAKMAARERWEKTFDT